MVNEDEDDLMELDADVLEMPVERPLPVVAPPAAVVAPVEPAAETKPATGETKAAEGETAPRAWYDFLESLIPYADLVALVGFVLFVGGIAAYSRPVAAMVAGLILMGLSWLIAKRA